MKKLVLVAFVLFSQISNAQVTKNLGDFNEIKVFDQITVRLIPSNENKVVITGDRADEVETVNKNGELKIRMPFPKLLSGNNIIVKLYFDNIESITASEGSIITSETTFKQTVLYLNSKSGATINVELKVDKLNVKANAGGIIELQGKAENQDVMITSGGILKAKELHTSQTTISVAAGGSADIYAKTFVDAKVKAGGAIFVYGKPEQINKEVFIGGTITEK